MKRVFLIRHAKAEKSDKDGDFARELSARGKEDIKIMANVLLGLNVMPSVVFSSSAKRCAQSAKRLCEALKFKGKIKLIDELYEADAGAVLDILSGLSDEPEQVFIIGHNPSITEASEAISHSVLDSLPTCGVCCVEFKDSFKNLDSARLVFFDFPKNHRD